MADQPLKELELVDRSNGLPLSEAVFRSLCQALRVGLYRPGDRLREEDVAQRLKVSRTPVREAFGRLMAKGLVEPAGGRGLIVRSLGITEVLELYAMREILEGAAARLAAQHASQLEIEALLDLENAFEARASDPAEMARLNRALHEAIFRAARNRYLDSALQELQDGIALLGVTTFSITGRPSTAAKEHRALIEAIAARDADRAERLARLHIGEALRSRLKLLQDR
ncbi:GntR family transcriptional regulator [Microvirga sp. KLBC 81]|uniref:GntR family transcriptional regulator n=1 Tax=Microvirga sp. KLBC 81 TaxID=1862707 RepID=UPI000D522E7F|nr:GntR family transcriptional regulator [Microvirga sp. KLBC 81]PVE23007.1 GntR family transcriptional regulator [Microvirga sp. KLBC 81]